jgi:hypothetical protein
LGLDCTVARLTLPRLPAIHLEDGSQRAQAVAEPRNARRCSRSRMRAVSAETFFSRSA